ncbi:MAG: methyltransferase domain-containing protein [Geobacteraceae bacterium]|nr:methyltransferase domain-containing protein [Geobacteraceae bacterium]
MDVIDEEIKKVLRFGFGRNWKSYLEQLNSDRIEEARKSLVGLLGIDDFSGRTFLDVGSGSGLFSLAARQLGATVRSFDFDPDSVKCTELLREQYFQDAEKWLIQQGSILDEQYLKTLDTYDIVYSWGVLHHTGDMWRALDNISSLVKPDAILCIAIYNDQGRKSNLWRFIKKIYCSGRMGKLGILSMFLPYYISRAIIASVVKKKNVFKEYKKNRGMSVYHDWIDWLGGFPFEVAKAEDIFHFYFDKGYILYNLFLNPGHGCNQYVFVKSSKFKLTL